jgi:hypothetical protein
VIYEREQLVLPLQYAQRLLLAGLQEDLNRREKKREKRMARKRRREDAERNVDR